MFSQFGTTVRMPSLVPELLSLDDEITWHGVTWDGTVVREGLSSMSLSGTIWERSDGSRLLEISIMDGGSCARIWPPTTRIAPEFSESYYWWYYSASRFDYQDESRVTSTSLPMLTWAMYHSIVGREYHVSRLQYSIEGDWAHAASHSAWLGLPSPHMYVS